MTESSPRESAIRASAPISAEVSGAVIAAASHLCAEALRGW
jgi:hypothetical protein